MSIPALEAIEDEWRRDMERWAVFEWEMWAYWRRLDAHVDRSWWRKIFDRKAIEGPPDFRDLIEGIGIP